MSANCAGIYTQVRSSYGGIVHPLWCFTVVRFYSLLKLILFEFYMTLGCTIVYHFLLNCHGLNVRSRHNMVITKYGLLLRLH